MVTTLRFRDKVRHLAKIGFFIPVLHEQPASLVKNVCKYVYTVFFHNQARYLAYQVVQIDSAKSPLLTHSSSSSQMDRQTRQTDGHAVF